MEALGIGVIYFVIIIAACSVGSLAGMGGGVIIKPLLDAVDAHDLLTISFYASSAAFSMALISTIKQTKNGIKLPWRVIVAVAAGALPGGVLGNLLFDWLLLFISNETIVMRIQIFLSVFLLLFSLIYSLKPVKSLHWQHSGCFLLVGAFLGCVAAFLGIGGGPINVALFMLCFNVPVKEATVYSILTILFSQGAKLIATGFFPGYTVFDLPMLVAVIPAATLGGFFGAKMSGILSPPTVLKVYRVLIVLVVGLNLSNWR